MNMSLEAHIHLDLRLSLTSSLLPYRTNVWSGSLFFVYYPTEKSMPMGWITPQDKSAPVNSDAASLGIMYDMIVMTGCSNES
jgi:hypothetical protein